MTQNLTRQLVDGLGAFRYDALPRPVVRQTKNTLYDSLGAVLAATSPRYPILALLERMTLGSGGTPESHVLGTALRTDAATAALAGGTLAYYCDIESHHPSANVHAVAVVGPAALAVGERTGSSGADMLAAVTAGIDVAARVSYALGPGAQYARGFHPSTVAGTFGAAVAAGLLLRLDADRFCDALGLAGTSASGLLSWVDDPSEQSRPVNIGLAAQAGVQASLLASYGVRGPADVFGGKYPFGAAFTGRWDQEALLAGLGERYEVGALFFKRNSCCVFIPAGLDGLLDVMTAQRLGPSDIEAVTVRAPLSTYHVVDDNPLRSHCLQYVLAVAAHRGRVDFDDIVEDRRSDPSIADLAGRITVVGDASLDERATPGHQSIGSITEVTTRAGATYVRDMEFPLGAAENPLSDDDLRAKFARLTTGVVDAERARHITAAVDELDSADDVGTLTGLLAP